MTQNDNATAVAAHKDAVRLREVRGGDVAALVANIRSYDLEVLHDLAPEREAGPELMRVVGMSTWVRTLEDQYGVVALLGIYPVPSDTATGFPWIAATDRLSAQHALWLTRNIRGLLSEMSEDRYCRHWGAVPKRREKFVRFIEYCGYTLTTEIITPQGATYIQFEGLPCRG